MLLAQKQCARGELGHDDTIGRVEQVDVVIEIDHSIEETIDGHAEYIEGILRQRRVGLHLYRRDGAQHPGNIQDVINSGAAFGSQGAPGLWCISLVSGDAEAAAYQGLGIGMIRIGPGCPVFQFGLGEYSECVGARQFIETGRYAPIATLSRAHEFDVEFGYALDGNGATGNQGNDGDDEEAHNPRSAPLG